MHTSKTRASKTPLEIAAPIDQTETQAAPSSAQEALAPVSPLPRQTKTALLSQMILDKNGASLPALMEATGWQAHTVRAALSGLRKSGLTITHVCDANGPRYRGIAAFVDRPTGERVVPTESVRPTRRGKPRQSDAADDSAAVGVAVPGTRP